MFWEIYDLVKESYDFDNAAVRPIRASGARWISHKIGAMTRILDKFGLYITHLENVAIDTSYRAKERNRIKGYLNKWKNSKMSVKFCFYLELLKPIMQLSLYFQKEKIDTVSAAIALGKVKGKLLMNKDVKDFNHIKTMKKYIKELEDGKVEFKTICLKILEA